MDLAIVVRPVIRPQFISGENSAFSSIENARKQLLRILRYWSVMQIRHGNGLITMYCPSPLSLYLFVRVFELFAAAF
jgi:hypothetical protein